MPTITQLRKEQAQRVMPLIGPLLDAWEAVPGDLRSEIKEFAPQLAEHLNHIFDAMEATRLERW